MNEEKVNLRKRTTHNEDNASDYDDEERQVENDVVDVIQSGRKFISWFFFTFLANRESGHPPEALSRVPLVHDGVEPDGDEDGAEEPEEEVKQEHGVLDPRADVGEVAREASSSPRSAPSASGRWNF